MKSTRVPGLHDLMTVKIMNAMTINNSANGIGPCTRVEHPIVHRRTQYFHKIQSKIQVAQQHNIATLQHYNITISTVLWILLRIQSSRHSTTSMSSHTFPISWSCSVPLRPDCRITGPYRRNTKRW